MRIKNLLLLSSIAIFLQFNIHGQNNAKDTIAFSDANTQEVIEFGKLLEATIHDNEPNKFIFKLNKDTFFDRVLTEYPNLDRKDDFIKGFLDGMGKALTSFPTEIIQEVQKGAYYDFINYRYNAEAQTYYCLFRLYSLETGMNYHDYRISKGVDKLQFCDMYVYLSGEHFSNTIGRMMGYTLPDDKLTDQDLTLDNSESKALLKAILLNKDAEYEKSYAILDGLKSKLSEEKFILIFKSLVASQIDETKYLKSLEDLIRQFPNDQTIALNEIDYHIYKEDYFEAIQTINALQNETEDDFLNYLKANVAFQDKNYDLALNLYTYTIENYTDFFEGQAGYLSTLVMMKNYTEATRYLDTLIDEGYEKDGLISYVEEDDDNGENILKSYSKSNQFKSWKSKID
ncbi:MAG: hypothetical protein WA775_01550 [Psychroserpens sp.]|uniref:hypothetical protein n=1 Tax=Psychroserpens sp. TaxID=2020870 RepID=UPI003CAD90A0